MAVRRCWLIERTIDSVNVARPHCVGGKVPSKLCRESRVRRRFTHLDRAPPLRTGGIQLAPDLRTLLGVWGHLGED